MWTIFSVQNYHLVPHVFYSRVFHFSFHKNCGSTFITHALIYFSDDNLYLPFWQEYLLIFFSDICSDFPNFKITFFTSRHLLDHILLWNSGSYSIWYCFSNISTQFLSALNFNHCLSHFQPQFLFCKVSWYHLNQPFSTQSETWSIQ